MCDTFEYERGETRWYMKHQFPNGQTIEISFYEEENYRDTVYYSICLDIFSKRKHRSKNFSEIRSTGKVGIASLIWAKAIVKQFIEFIPKQRFSRWCKYICIFTGWADNRRRRVYERGLKDLGFEYGKVMGERVLKKTIQYKE